MKTAWVGWYGNGVTENFGCLNKVNKTDLFITGEILGIRIEHAHAVCHNIDALIERLNDYDVVFVEGYYFSVGHREDIKPYIPFIAEHPRWKSLKCKKILFDTESGPGGQIKWYIDKKPLFDDVLTTNESLSEVIYEPYIDIEYYGPIKKYEDREISLLFTGAYIDSGYRAELASRVKDLGGEVYDAFKLSREEWIEKLKNTKNYVATLSIPQQSNYHKKNKPYEVAQYGCRPIVEDTKYNYLYGKALKGFEDINTEYNPEEMALWARQFSGDKTWERILEKLS